MNWVVLQFSILTLFARCMLTFAANNGKCDQALGMEDGSIKDSQITAKTWLYFKRRDSRYYRPYFARLNYKKLSGGWCSTDLITSPQQYVEVDLLHSTKITGIATQGRYNGQEWVEFFKIEYKRYNETRYRRYLEKGKWKVFRGNTDTNTTVKQLFKRPLVVQSIRILPVGNQFTINCMRFEIYGCSWRHAKDGLVEYSAPFGEMRKSISLQDDTYDGYIPYKATEFVFGGIGKLTDGQIATEGPVYNPQEQAYTQWVGYRNNPSMLFMFNATRKFNSVSFYVLNEGKSIRLFEKVSIEISTDGVKYTHVGSYLSNKEARERQGVLQIKIPMNENVGSFLRCSFDINESWLLVTELEFETEPYIAPTVPKSPVDVSYKWTMPLTTFQTVTTKKVTKKTRHNNKLQERQHETLLETDSTETNNGLSFPIILTIVLVGSVIVFGFVSFIARLIHTSRKAKKRRARETNKSLNSGSKSEEERIGLNEPDTRQEIYS